MRNHNFREALYNVQILLLKAAAFRGPKMLHIRPGQPPGLRARPQPVGTRRGDPDRRHRQPHVRVSQREVQQGLRLGKML